MDDVHSVVFGMAGKTELCKTLAETYYGSEKDMIRIDMSEYGERVRASAKLQAGPEHAIQTHIFPPSSFVTSTLYRD